jgi:hypothetical protein
MMGLTWESSRLCRFDHVAASWVQMSKSYGSMHTPCIFSLFFLMRNASSHLKEQKRESKNYLDPLYICWSYHAFYLHKKSTSCFAVDTYIANTQISFRVSIKHATSSPVGLWMPKLGRKIQTEYSCLDHISTSKPISPHLKMQKLLDANGMFAMQ